MSDTSVISSKQPATSSAGELKAKRPRKNLSLEKKLEIVKCHEAVAPIHCFLHHQTSNRCERSR
ncbi:hypothetical protein E2C01_077733 [Portunus trituberculatus]|uniref:Uncharacterized protein n=1 Tax=Portunus trituberculatus TaxID=210409 RepID=A0A5B7IKZ3_PORTR|nr:hypothetical protein [Portunus trituberculatus]